MPSAAAAAAVDARLPWRRSVKRIRRAETSEEEEDLLSSLPDSIIGQIFSFLSIKDILRTTAVSKRWNRLWTNTPNISYSSGWIKSLFSVNFLGLSSSLHRAFSQCSLTRFQIDGIWYDPDRAQVFDFWLRSAIAHRVQDISLSMHQITFHSRPSYPLPHFFFTYLSLVSLHLHGCDFTLCRGVSWNLLKVLRIGNVKMADGLLDVVVNGSPALECLELVMCWGMSHIRLDSRKLRVLVINGYSYPRYFPGVVGAEEAHDADLTLGVSAPHLLSLQILGEWYGKREIRLHQVSSLVQVKLDFELIPFVEHMDENLTLLLRALSSVSRFVIGSDVLMRFRKKTEIMMPPLGLRCQTLILGDSVKGSDFLGLIPLLGCTRHLEKLVISLDGHCDRGECNDILYDCVFGPSWWKIPKMPWVNHLRTIEMNGFRATPPKRAKCDLLMIGFLLREAVVLEKMVIDARSTRTANGAAVASSGGDNMEELQREVLGFPRASKSSKVIFNYLHS